MTPEPHFSQYARQQLACGSRRSRPEERPIDRNWRLKLMTLLNECSSVRRHACGIAQENSLKVLLASAARSRRNAA